jgi:hypothetical protein
MTNGRSDYFPACDRRAALAAVRQALIAVKNRFPKGKGVNP